MLEIDFDTRESLDQIAEALDMDWQVVANAALTWLIDQHPAIIIGVVTMHTGDDYGDETDIDEV
jgi:predicted transcriptional regulator